MAPDRGRESIVRRSPRTSMDISDEMLVTGLDEDGEDTRRTAQDLQKELTARGSEPQNFTIRGIAVGLIIGVVICFSNTYFGLQTGWVSGMAMPSALIGFAFFKALKPYLKMTFSPVENVLIQSVAGSVGTMPLGCGFVGVIPALEFLLRQDETPNGPLDLSLGKLCLWAVGICLFGVVFGVPLRKEVIIREKLKFPSGTATALMIGVLHGGEKGKLVEQDDESANATDVPTHGDATHGSELQRQPSASAAEVVEAQFDFSKMSNWKANIRLLMLAFGGSTLYTLFSYFVPQIRSIPILGLPLARTWLWTLNPSPAYVAQGIIMGPATTMHMLIGAIVGWGILSPIAKHKGWAPGPVDDWNTGSKGWIVWVSLAIMLADSIVSLGWLLFRGLMYVTLKHGPKAYHRLQSSMDGQDEHQPSFRWRDLSPMSIWSKVKRSVITATQNRSFTTTHDQNDESEEPLLENSDELDNNNRKTLNHASSEVDAPPEQLVSNLSFIFWLVLSVVLYFTSIHFAFPHIMPFSASVLALILAALLSVMGVRALGETDLNPVSGISKITQLIFSLVIPSSNRNGVIINLLAGAVSEAGALQAGDLLQDLKAGHLLGAAPSAQFYGQLIGSVFGAVISAVVYKLYVRVYEVPGDLFQVPTAYVWIFSARLVTGQGLPEMAGTFAIGAAIIFAALTALRTKEFGALVERKVGYGNSWQSFIPGGIAVAVGMYNTPSFTLARAFGGIVAWYWVQWRRKDETTVVVLASGLILGEGLFSIVNLLLANGGVPHL